MRLTDLKDWYNKIQNNDAEDTSSENGDTNDSEATQEIKPLEIKVTEYVKQDIKPVQNVKPLEVKYNPQGVSATIPMRKLTDYFTTTAVIKLNKPKPVEVVEEKKETVLIE